MADKSPQPKKLPPELLIAIGKLTVNFNAFEAYMYAAFCLMTGDKGPVARAILGRIRQHLHKAVHGL